LIIMRPGIELLSRGAVEVVLSSAFWAASPLMTKRLSSVDSNLAIVLRMSAIVTALPFVLALAVWVQPSPRILAITMGLGVLSAVIRLCIANGLRHADVTAMQPISFTRLVWAALVGYLLFGETPDILTGVGASVILGASLYVSLRESRLARERGLGRGSAGARASRRLAQGLR